jgi:type IV secretory pathway VirB2 component (pilin)
LLKARVAGRGLAEAIGAKFPEFGTAAKAITALVLPGTAEVSTFSPLGARALPIHASFTGCAADAIAARGVAAVGSPRRGVWTTELAFAAALEFVSGLVTTQGVFRSARALPVDAYLPREATSVGGAAALSFPGLAYTLRRVAPAARYTGTGYYLAAHTSTSLNAPRATTVGLVTVCPSPSHPRDGGQHASQESTTQQPQRLAPRDTACKLPSYLIEREVYC